MHAHTALLNELRSLPGFSTALLGSDSENVRWLQEAFHFAANASHAATLAVVAGVDQEMDSWGGSLYLANLAEAATDHPDVAVAVDRAAGNVLRAKFAAGLFDAPPARDESLPSQFVRTPEALALARDAVLQSATLLTNGGGVLPLTVLASTLSASSASSSSSAGAAAPTVAVLGPLAGGCPSDLTQGCDARGAMVGDYAYVPPLSLLRVAC
jgi:beta-glucosidase